MKGFKNRKAGTDKLFVLVAALVVANLSYALLKTTQIITSGAWTSLFLWALATADLFAIIGGLWLISNHRKRRRIEQEAQSKENKPLG